MKRLRKYASSLVDSAVRHGFENPTLKRFLDISTERHWRASAILERIKIDNGVFLEYGCGDGLENNTVQVLMHGWSGVWNRGERPVRPDS